MRVSIALICLMLLLVACSGQEQQPESIVLESGATQEGITAELTEESSEATEVASPTEVANTQLALGEMVFHTVNETGFACVTCHYTSERRLLGPGLADTQERVMTYNLEDNVTAYLHTSIVDPTAFITPADPAFPENIMPRNYAEILTDEEIEAVIVYILSL